MAPVFLPPAVVHPATPAPAAVAVHSQQTPAPHGWTSHRVEAGETVRAIADRHGTTVRAIVVKNRLPYGGGLIKVGQKLWVPRQHAPAVKAVPTSPRPTSSGSSTAHKRTTGGTTAYRVRPGDTLSHIALAHGTTVSRLMKLNHLSDTHALQAGRTLTLPGARTGGSTSTSDQFDHDTFAGRTYERSVVEAAARNRATLARHATPSREEMRGIITAAARRQGVDPRLALAVAYQESGWDQRQVSVANAIGTMQIIPTSGDWASQMVGRELNVMRAEDNVTAGVAILRYLTREADSLDQAIAGYYQGLGSVEKHGMYPDTKKYVASVKSHYRRM